MGEVVELASNEDIAAAVMTINSDDEYETDSEQALDLERTNEHNSDSEDSEEPFNETLLERFYALQDAIPFSLQRNISKSISYTIESSKTVAGYAGSAAWVIVTASTILLLPLMMEVEKETAAVQQESQIANQQQQAAQIVA